MKTLNHQERIEQQEASLIVLAKNGDGHHEYSVEGLNLIVYKQVFSPLHFNGWGIMTPPLRERIKPGNDVLEIGCGTGVTSLLLAKDGANVTCSDISPLAVENTRVNAIKNELKLKDVILSDVYDGFKSHLKFDAIYWNSPWMEIIGRDTIDNLLEYGLFDRGFKNHERLLSQSKYYLKPGGKLYLGHASFGDYERLEEMLDQHGYEYKVIADEASVEIIDVEFYLYECWLKKPQNQIFISMPFTGTPYEDIIKTRQIYQEQVQKYNFELLEQFIGIEEKVQFETASYDPEFIVNKDIALLNEAQVLLVDLSRPSVGSAFEVAYAKNTRNIPVIGFNCPDEKTARHPWYAYYLDEICQDIESALIRARKL